MFGLPNPNPDEKDENEKNESQDLKKKRDQYAVEIRKQKREELLSKKRNRNLEIDQKLQSGTLTIGTNLADDKELKDCINQWLNQNYDMSQFLPLVEAAGSNDRFKQHFGVIGLRKILSNEQNPPIQAIIDANMVPKLIAFMQREDEPHLQLEAAWTLTNVASGTTQQTQSIIDKGGIACFVKLLHSSRAPVAEQAIWALGNIAGDSPGFRDLILQFGGLKPLLEIVSTTTDQQILKHGVWVISNLCRGKPLPDIKQVEIAIPILAQVLKTQANNDILTDAAWALSNLARTEAKIREIAEKDIIPALVRHLSNDHLQLVVPCLRILGNIVTGNENQTSLVLQAPGFLEGVFTLMTHQKKAVKREACWVVSNITAGPASQIEVIMSTQDYVAIIMNIVRTELPEVQREAAWILSNATKNSNPVQIARMIEYGVLDCFLELLECEDPRTVEVILEAIFNMLNWGAVAASETGGAENEFLVILETKGGVKKIEDLQTHPNNEVYLRALKILEAHFEIDSLI